MKIEKFLDIVNKLNSTDANAAQAASDDFPVLAVGNPTSQDIIGLKVIKYGRMGNNFMQIVNAVHLAKLLKLEYVWAPQLQLSNGVTSVKSGAVEIFSQEMTPPDGLFVTGTFFKLPIPSEMRPNNALRRDLALECILPFLDIDETEGEGRDTEIVVHFRSGDIFSPNPHPNYVQPPLAYYTKIISAGVEENYIDHVHVVAEDDANPCVGALRNWLTQKGIASSYQSSTLKADVSRLRMAKNVVYGTGTFGFGISLISLPIHRIFLFGHTGWYGNLPHVGKAKIYSAGDDYIQPGSWRNTAEQRRLMIDYPPEGIREVNKY